VCISTGSTSNMQSRQMMRIMNQLSRHGKAAFVTNMKHSTSGAESVRTFATLKSAASSRILFLGAPGAGKGTYAKVLFEAFGIPHVSSGDIIRHHIKTGTAIGKRLQESYNQGKLVSDDAILALIEERLFQSKDTNHGRSFLLDGLPRNIFQADALQAMSDKYAKSLGTSKSAFDIVLNLLIREDILIQKIVKRRVCEKCGRNYNLANIMEPENHIYMPPLLSKVDGICDDDGGKLLQRPDDQESTVRERLKVYYQQTAPLIDYYRKNKDIVFLDFDVSQGKDRSSPKLIAMFKEIFESRTR